jgi:hypothetical protein
MDKEEDIENWKSLKYRMNSEGFHYCFIGYSDWKEIEDEKFQLLRKEYLRISKELENYIIEKNEQFNK